MMELHVEVYWESASMAEKMRVTEEGGRERTTNDKLGQLL
jgi:hypothetical protein